MSSTWRRAIQRAVDFDETPHGHAVSYDANGDLVGLTLIDVRRLLDEMQGEEPRLELPAKASTRAGAGGVWVCGLIHP